MNPATHYTADELRGLGIEVGRDVMVSRRVAFYAVGEMAFGDFTRIDDGCILTGSVRLGRRIHLAPYCILYGKAGIEVGDYSGFGVYTVMHSESDDYSGESMFGPCVPDRYQPGKVRAAIRIGRAVLGGARCTFLPGVRVGDGACIGAHSLVKGDCEADHLYAGVPARRVRPCKAGMWALLAGFEADNAQ